MTESEYNHLSLIIADLEMETTMWEEMSEWAAEQLLSDEYSFYRGKRQAYEAVCVILSEWKNKVEKVPFIP